MGDIWSVRTGIASHPVCYSWFSVTVREPGTSLFI